MLRAYRAKLPARTPGPSRHTTTTEWLDEEDGEEDVLGDSRDGYRRRRTPTVAQYESRDLRRQDNPDAENGRSDGRNFKRGTGLFGILALGCRAATVRLCLRENAL
jgi:hypothetical protein